MSRPFSVEACDFSGWATRNDLKCSDGRVIRRDAFKNNDGIKSPAGLESSAQQSS